MFDSPAIPSLLEALPATALATPEKSGTGALGFGVPGVDDWLKDGLRRNGLHEFYPATDTDKPTAMALALLLATRACGPTGQFMWLRLTGSSRHHQYQHPCGPGLMELGLNPNTILLMQLTNLEGLLKAAVDCVRHGSAGAVVMEMDGEAASFDLTASRRLTLAAERSGTFVLVVRSHGEPLPSAAQTRWQVASAPSTPLAANAPGHPVFDLTLLRQRGGRDGLTVQLEWDREHAAFKQASAGQTPLSGGLPAFPASGATDQSTPRAA